MNFRLRTTEAETVSGVAN